jgi:hypothetical protein
MLPVTVYACSDDTTLNTTPTDAGGDVTTTLGDANSASPDTGPTEDASPKLDAASDGDGSHDATDETPFEAGVPEYLCTQAALDAPCGPEGGDCRSLTRVEILFPTDILPEQYTHHCVKVKVGTQVAFGGKFSLHNIHGEGGDTPNPIPAMSTDPPIGPSGRPELDITMTTANKTYGFECQQHPTVMFGAVQVVAN